MFNPKDFNRDFSMETKSDEGGEYYYDRNVTTPPQSCVQLSCETQKIQFDRSLLKSKDIKK